MRYISSVDTRIGCMFVALLIPMILLVSLLLGSWFFWSFGPLLVLPMVDILRLYLLSNLGRRVFGVTITMARVARVEGLANPARVVAYLLFVVSCW
jgi:hypothetical protein